MREDIRNIVNTLKILSIDMIDAAKNGSPGIALSAAPIIYTLYAYHMNINPKDPNWINRDRFVLSAAHGAPLLYATLFLAGYPITLDDLVRYTQLNSITPGYPERLKTQGVDASTGPLGQGISKAVGMAMAEKYLQAKIDEKVKKQKLLNHTIYCLVSDGDLEEGMTSEAIALAGMHNLNNLIVLYDSNNVTADNFLYKSSKEDIIRKFEAAGWYTDYIADGENVDKIDKAIRKAKRIPNKPSFIEIKTIIGKDSYNQGTNIVHDHILSKDDIENLRENLNIKTGRFEVTKEVVDKFRKQINNRCTSIYNIWQDYFKEYQKQSDQELKELVNFLQTGTVNLQFNAANFQIQNDYQEELTESNSKMLNIIASKTPFFLGGSADLSASTKTYLNQVNDFSSKTYNGRNIFFGLREHAASSIVSGMTYYNLRTFLSTYLRFVDYQKDGIREAASEHLPVTFIYSHDGISDTQLGVTAQAYEQIDSLRNIAYLDVYRPGDINEVIGMWDNILKTKNTSASIITQNITHILAGTDAKQVCFGAYIVRKETNELSGTIITCGKELIKALLIANELEKENIYLRVVSCVSQEVFDRQTIEYKNQVLGNKKVIALEAGRPYTWTKYTTLNNVIGITTNGMGGLNPHVEYQLRFDKDNLKQRIKELLNQ